MVVLLAYLPSFTGEFILDDVPLIKNSEYLREWHSIGSYLAQEDGYNKYSGSHTGYYRPLVNLSYTIDYKVWGLSAPGFKITNLLLHILACFSIFTLYNLFFHKRHIALMLVLIFALHPVNTETVSWVSCRNNIMATLFGTLSLIYYIRSYKNRKYYEYILAILFFSLAILSKEFGLMLLPVFFLYQRILNNRRETIYVELREYIPFILIIAIYFILRFKVIGFITTPSGFNEVITRIYNIPYVLFLNFKLIFIPFKLHSFVIKYPEGLFNARSIVCLFCFFLAIIPLWIYRKKRLLIFSVGAFLIAIFPVLGVIKTISPSLIAMRWLYFPLPFILLLLAQPLEKIYKFNCKICLCLLITVVFYLGINSYTLNRFLWHSSDDFFKQEVLHFKNYLYVDGLADFYKREEKPELAMMFYEKNFESGLKRAINYFDYADLLFEKGDWERSLEYLEKAWPLCYSPDELGSYFHKKGLVYFKLNNLGAAEKNIRKALNLSPKYPAYWESLGVIHGKMGNHVDALKSFKKSLKLGIISDTIYKNMANGYLFNNECKAAFRLINRINKDKKDAGLTRLLKNAERCLAAIDG